MMIHRLMILALLLSACGGNLSDDQRKKLKEGMANQKIVQVSDSDIVTAAHEQGKQIYEQLERAQFDPTKVDSIANYYRVKIKWVVPGAGNAQETEQQLIDAYVMGMATRTLQDNIQRLHRSADQAAYDSLLYSKPKVSPMPDGVEQLEGIWNIYLSKKQIVLSISAAK